MDLYASRLIQSLSESDLMRKLELNIVSKRPPTPAFIAPLARQGSLGRFYLYLLRYLYYQPWAYFYQGDVNHVADHSYAFLLSSLDQRRTVITCHDVEPLQTAISGRYRSMGVALILFRYAMMGLKRARFLIADSQATRNDLVRSLGISPDRIEVVYPPLDPVFDGVVDAVSQTEARRRLGLDAERKYILNVGSLVPRKNIEGLLNALALVNRRYSEPVYLLRVGPRLNSRLAGLADQLKLADRIVELGRLSSSELALAYRAADTLLFPSWYEGFGWPAAEAMASGTPVVASKAGALPEVVGDCGLLVDPADADGQSQAVLDLFNQPELVADLVGKGRVRAGLFNRRRMGEAVAAVYQRLLS